MKISREIMRRLETTEDKLGPTSQIKYVLKDFNEHYFGECGCDISQEQFCVWVKQQEIDVEVVVMKYTVDGGNLDGEAVCLEKKIAPTPLDKGKM